MYFGVLSSKWKAGYPEHNRSAEITEKNVAVELNLEEGGFLARDTGRNFPGRRSTVRKKAADDIEKYLQGDEAPASTLTTL